MEKGANIKLDFLMERVIGFKERRYIEELRILTKSTALDCVIDLHFDRIIYVIKNGDMGIAIGRHGENINKLQRVLGKRIEMVEEAVGMEDFVRNLFKPAEVSRVFRDEDNNMITVYLQRKADLGIAIGKGGSNVEKARILCKRYFGMEIGGILPEVEE